jgi:hypothetical protein
VADNDSDLMKEFQEFLSQKQANEQAKKDEEDFEVEIWDEKGRGVRTRRSHAKPFLQSLGLDPDAESGGDEDDKGGDDKGGNSSKSNRSSTGKQSSNATSGGVARKYFTKPTGK